MFNKYCLVVLLQWNLDVFHELIPPRIILNRVTMRLEKVPGIHENVLIHQWLQWSHILFNPSDFSGNCQRKYSSHHANLMFCCHSLNSLFVNLIPVFQATHPIRIYLPVDSKCFFFHIHSPSCCIGIQSMYHFRICHRSLHMFYTIFLQPP